VIVRVGTLVVRSRGNGAHDATCVSLFYAIDTGSNRVPDPPPRDTEISFIHLLSKHGIYIFTASCFKHSRSRSMGLTGDTVKERLSAHGGFIVFPAEPMDGHGVSRIYVQFVFSQPERSLFKIVFEKRLQRWTGKQIFEF
jgi:hypothetical protein